MCATHLAQWRMNAAVHIDTGTGIPENRDYVQKIAEQHQFNLLAYGPPEKKDCYESIVMKYGFPGPAQHRACYIRLKERQIRKLIRDHKKLRHDKILLITGIRQGESARRMGYDEPVHVDGAKVWVAPLFEFSALDITDYMTLNAIPRNPVVDLLHRSGECNCGAFAKPNERKEMRLWFPDFVKSIDDLEERTRAAGHDWAWGTHPPRVSKNQLKIPFMPMCVGCSENTEE